MTADRRRRRRRTWIAFVVGVGAILAATALSGVAVVSLSNSTAGRDAADDLEMTDTVQRLPWTSTALIGVVDSRGTLAASVVAVLAPDGRGGTIVSISPSADAASGNASIIRPLGTVFEVEGPEAWRAGMEQVTGLSFDLAEVLDEQRFSELVDPLGGLPTVFPYTFVDANTDTTYQSGLNDLSGVAAARAVAARNDSGPAWQFDTAREAVWRALANRVGDGIGSLPSEARFESGSGPTTTDDFFDALFDAPVEFRSLAASQLDPVRVELELPVDHAAAIGAGAADAVLSLERGDVVLVFGSIAPARVGAPFEGPTVRLVSGYTDADAAALTVNRSDLISSSLDLLLAAQSNVRSVVDQPDLDVPERTRVVVADPSTLDSIGATFGELFGDPEVVVAEVRIEGIDVEITLGREHLDAYAARRATGETVVATTISPSTTWPSGSASDSAGDADGVGGSAP